MSASDKEDDQADATFDEVLAEENTADTASKKDPKPVRTGGASTSIPNIVRNQMSSDKH